MAPYVERWDGNNGPYVQEVDEKDVEQFIADHNGKLLDDPEKPSANRQEFDSRDTGKVEEQPEPAPEPQPSEPSVTTPLVPPATGTTPDASTPAPGQGGENAPQ